MTTPARLEAVLQRIDAINAHDPAQEHADGLDTPAAQLYGRRMSAVLKEFAPTASEHLQIAVRGQHIERWTRARSAYPDGRTGYLEWRRDAARFHGERVGELMALEGYGSSDIQRVAALIRKQAIKRDAEAQILEDVACLVFMRWYFAPFAKKRTPEELLSIVEKTARKMSDAGRREALKLPLPAELIPAVQSAGQSSG